MTPVMWRSIYGMSAYIIFMMMILFFFVDDMWSIEYDNYDVFFSTAGVPTQKCRVYTLLFNTFVWFHIFNQINSRKVGAKDFNVFHTILANWYFLAVIAFIVVAQFCIVEFGGTLARTFPLS